jgi:hypothetical protein
MARMDRTRSPHRQSILLFLATLPWFASVALPGVLLLYALGLVDKLEVDRRHAILFADISPRGARLWHYSTTIGRLVLMHPHARRSLDVERVLEHERVHVRQHEDLALIAALIGALIAALTGHHALGLAVWWSAGLWQLPMYLTAALRYGSRNAYLDAEHERAAYAQTDLERGRESWLSRRERTREA